MFMDSNKAKLFPSVWYVWCSFEMKFSFLQKSFENKTWKPDYKTRQVFQAQVENISKNRLTTKGFAWNLRWY